MRGCLTIMLVPFALAFCAGVGVGANLVFAIVP